MRELNFFHPFYFSIIFIIINNNKLNKNLKIYGKYCKSIWTSKGWCANPAYPPPSSLWTNVYSVYNADAAGSSSLKTSLVASYNGESNANDSFGSLNGTAVGGLTYGTGKIGNAFKFNGTNSYINLPTSSLQLTTFSINFWVFNPAPQTTTIAANFGNDGQNKGWYLDLINTNGHGIRFVAFNNNVNMIGLNAAATSAGGYTNRWSMATLTVNGTSVKMYLDGSLVNSGTMSNTINYTSTTYPLIGGYRVNNGGVSSILANNTRLDAFNIWDKELSASEITELYNSGNGAQYITDNFYKPTPNDALNTYNGTAQGGLTYGVGKVGTAFQFNGSNGYVSLPNSSGQFNFTGDFSISLWMTQSANGNIFENFYGINTTIRYGYNLYTQSGRIRFAIYTGTATHMGECPTPIVNNTWYHIVITKTTSNAYKTYINGNLATTSALGGNITNNPVYNALNQVNIGSDVYNGIRSDYFNGSMDALNVWDKELSASEITELYNSGNGKQYPN